MPRKSLQYSRAQCTSTVRCHYESKRARVFNGRRARHRVYYYNSTVSYFISSGQLTAGNLYHTYKIVLCAAGLGLCGFVKNSFFLSFGYLCFASIAT